MNLEARVNESHFYFFYILTLYAGTHSNSLLLQNASFIKSRGMRQFPFLFQEDGLLRTYLTLQKNQRVTTVLPCFPLLALPRFHAHQICNYIIMRSFKQKYRRH